MRILDEQQRNIYEAENVWWYYFFKVEGSHNYDAEYANSLRLDGISPEEAVEIIKNS